MQLFGLSRLALENWILQKGEKPFRAKQIFDWIYQSFATSWEEMTNLPKSLKSALSEEIKFHTLKLAKTQVSEDGETIKYLWELEDGRFVESVFIQAPDRQTVCVSSQVGCPARCAFCASGKQGWMRNLSTAEIVEQVIQIEQDLRKKGKKVTNIVFMGMGEPFENYTQVLEAIRLLTAPEGLNLSQRRLTVSTVGLVDKILQFSEEGLKVNLVLSLHAPNQRIRQKIIPYARKYSLDELLLAMRHFAAKTKRDITYEYTLLAGINDASEHAQELAALLEGHPCTVNLIPYNPVEGLRLQRPRKEAIEEFKQILEQANIPTTWRYTKGKDIAAACGQLALQTQS